MADVYHNAIFRKPGATFADATEANADRMSMFTPELRAASQEMFSTMLAAGVLLEPLSFQWDQSTQTLTVIKKVTSKEAYRACVTIPSAVFQTAIEQAGWVPVDGGWGPTGQD